MDPGGEASAHALNHPMNPPAPQVIEVPAAPPPHDQLLNHPSAPAHRNPVRHPHPISLRFQALALAEYGVPVQHIKHYLNMSVNTIQRLRKTARDRGFDPAVSPQLKLEYVEDAPRSGRPSKLTPQMEEAIVAAFTGEGREADQKVKTARVAEEMGISATTVLRVLTSKGFGWERKKGNPYDGSWKVVPKKRTPLKDKAKKTETVQKPVTMNPVDPSLNTPIAPDLEMLAMNAVDQPGNSLNAPDFSWHPHPNPRPEI